MPRQSAIHKALYDSFCVFSMYANEWTVCFCTLQLLIFLKFPLTDSNAAERMCGGAAARRSDDVVINHFNFRSSRF